MVICFSVLGRKRNGLNIDTICLDGFFLPEDIKQSQVLLSDKSKIQNNVYVMLAF